METFTIVEEAIAAVNKFVALPESEKTLDEAKRVTAMMDEAGKFIAEASEAMYSDLQSSISHDQERREILKEELEEVNAGVLHLARRSDGALQFRDYINKTEDDQNEGTSDEGVVLTNEMQFEDVEEVRHRRRKEHLGRGGKRDKIPHTSVIGSGL
ncbi:hypothetical protein IW261DRAFT_1065711 [Armillaria novae-zelandiae]|uniref:Uncharacterized protein n=1 Tax=Armillaria novae-zelandiae TaxID=153914 RepID=A0AA39PBP9_9AGAR|nr:hypothetical protein IW261DRAFT_1065711 [Armillaria novae-zelandiae]